MIPLPGEEAGSVCQDLISGSLNMKLIGCYRTNLPDRSLGRAKRPGEKLAAVWAERRAQENSRVQLCRKTVGAVWDLPKAESCPEQRSAGPGRERGRALEVGFDSYRAALLVP